ncbi:antitoxin VbhA family protein [Methylobacterium pseudosasicola]|uniref:Antitoxin VbhA domain-containing protein n=1 Tax=Methylobacterium pseudosasicola TaxID=582667 RepID=A0A1I4U787_9HYPH|nr:antitoxin VbhA family protein [Methylobacterium pseudosasicola]SFM84681.1 hypothetical protein SAMN05192568_10645 [Methylobacterium pseudosasicola]
MIDEYETRSRREAVDAAMASARLAGVILSDEARTLFEAYVTGEISSDAVMERALAIWGRHEKSPPR